MNHFDMLKIEYPQIAKEIDKFIVAKLARDIGAKIDIRKLSAAETIHVIAEEEEADVSR